MSIDTDAYRHTHISTRSSLVVLIACTQAIRPGYKTTLGQTGVVVACMIQDL